MSSEISRRKYGNPSSQKKRYLKAYTGPLGNLTKEDGAWLAAHNARVAKKFMANIEALDKILEETNTPMAPLTPEALEKIEAVKESAQS